MDMDIGVMELIEQLEDLLENSKPVPFTNKHGIDKNTAFEILTEIRLKLPNELKQSKWVIEERNKILLDAQKESEALLKEAEDKIAKLVDTNEVTRRAYEQAEEIMEEAKIHAKEMRFGARQYAESVIVDLEECVRDSLGAIKEQNTLVENFFIETLEILHDNKNELKNG